MNKLLTTICLIVGKEKRQYKCQHLDGTVYRYNSGICPGSGFLNICANESFNLTELTSVRNYLMTQHFMLVNRSSRFTGKHPCRSAISITFPCNFIEIARWHVCSPVNLRHIVGTPFLRNTSGCLLLNIRSQNT